MESPTASPPRQLHFTCNIELEDLLAFHSHTLPPDSLKASKTLTLFYVLSGAAALLLSAWLLLQNNWNISAMFSALAIYGVTALHLGYQASRPLKLKPLSGPVAEPLRSRLLKLDTYTSALGPHTLSITQAGVTEAREHSTTAIDWPAVTRVIKTAAHLFIVCKGNTGFIIPLRSVAGDPAHITSQIEQWWGSQAEHPPQQAP